jgi:hypothetical protein
MAKILETSSITAPGFLGLNSQDASLDLASGFALTAKNCVIDKYGRIGARKGWIPEHPTLAALGANYITAVGELLTDSGEKYIIATSDNNKLFRLLDTGVLSELTYGGEGVAPEFTASNWQIVALNECLYLYQEGHDPLIYDPALSTTTYRRISEKPGYVATVRNANTVLAAYGRLWTASTQDNKVTVWFSDVLAGHVWDTGTSGFLAIDQVWQNGADNIVGLGAHNGFLYIFGRNNILVYANATSPADMTLADSITGIGCIARDSIQNTGSDIVFLSDTGLRSVLRTIQEKSAPLRDLSKNVRDEMMAIVQGEVEDSIKSVYNPFEGFYLISYPSVQQVYCFDTKAALPDGSARVTVWEKIDPRAFCYTTDRKMLMGMKGAVGKYFGYQDNGGKYLMQYYTNHVDLGNPNVTSVPKKITVFVIGGNNQAVVAKWGYDFIENYQSQIATIKAQGLSFYNEDIYTVAEYADGVLTVPLVVYPNGAGKIFQTGYEADINGAPLSIQKIEIQAKTGKLI